MFHWRQLSPVFEPALSQAHLTSHNCIFWLGDGTLRADQRSAPHWHDTYEIGLIVEGRGVIVVEDREYPYRPGQVYVVDDMKPHMGYSESAATRLFVVHFQPALLQESWIGQVRAETGLVFMSDFSDGGAVLPLDDPFTALVAALLESIREQAAARDYAWEVIVGGQILQLMGLLARRLIGQPGIRRVDLRRREALRRIRPILDRIERDFAEPLTLDQMAEAGYVSRSHCCMLFQLALNTTPITYRNHRRISEARRLLLYTELPVRAIADQVGFSSPQEFNRLFLRENHVTPTHFRQRFLESLQKISS